jgi:predicted HTH domain antitoxin
MKCVFCGGTLRKDSEVFKNIASEIQFFPNIEQKEQFLFILRALFSRIISLQKAAEIMEMEPDMFIKLLDSMGLEFSYLSEEDISIEKEMLIDS